MINTTFIISLNQILVSPLLVHVARIKHTRRVSGCITYTAPITTPIGDSVDVCGAEIIHEQFLNPSCKDLNANLADVDRNITIIIVHLFLPSYTFLFGKYLTCKYFRRQYWPYPPLDLENNKKKYHNIPVSFERQTLECIPSALFEKFPKPLKVSHIVVSTGSCQRRNSEPQV